MTIDDSTLLAQAVSNSSKRSRRLIHRSVGHKSLYAAYVLWRSALALSERKIDPSTASPYSFLYPIARLNHPIHAYLLQTILLPFLLSLAIAQTPFSRPNTFNGIPTIPGTVVASAIPLLASLGGSDRNVSAEIAMIIAAGLCRVDNVGQNICASTFILQLDPVHAPWAIFAQAQAALRYLQEQAGKSVKRRKAEETGGNLLSDSEDESPPTSAVDGSRDTAWLSLLVKDISPSNPLPSPIDAYWSIKQLLDSWSNTKLMWTAIWVRANPLLLLGLFLLTSSSVSGSAIPSHDYRHSALYSMLVFMPTLLEGGLSRSVRGALKIGFGSFGGLARSAGILGISVYYGYAGLGSAIHCTAAVFSVWLWQYRLRHCITFVYAISFLTTYLASATIAHLTGYSMNLAIPLILLRLHLAACPPKPRPAQEAEEERKKPDPQKGLTPWEERDVSLVPEFGWYVLLESMRRL